MVIYFKFRTIHVYFKFRTTYAIIGFPTGSAIKNLPAGQELQENAGSISGSERSPGRGHGSPLQYSCQENPMDRGPWLAKAHRVTKELDLTEVTASTDTCYYKF